jgi:alpha-N-acetylglucosaminidase
MFYDHLAQCLAQGKDYKDPKKRVYGREAFRANAFYDKLADWELQFIRTRHPLPSEPHGDEIELARKLLNKYTPAIKAAYPTQNKTNR